MFIAFASQFRNLYQDYITAVCVSITCSRPFSALSKPCRQFAFSIAKSTRLYLKILFARGVVVIILVLEMATKNLFLLFYILLISGDVATGVHH